MRSVRQTLLCLVVFGCFGSALSDTIVLKNGQRLEGLVVSEDETHVVFTLGAGEMRLNREQIASVEKAKASAEEQKRFLLHESQVPSIQKDLVARFDTLSKQANGIKKKQRELTGLKKELAQREELLASLATRIGVLHDNLSKLNANEDVRSYNAAVNRHNAEVAKHRAMQNAQIQGAQRRAAGTQVVAEFAHAVVELLQQSQYRLSADQFRKIPPNEQAKSRAVLGELIRRGEEWMDLFPKSSVGAQAMGAHRIVEARLNGETKAMRLMVDTGASQVVLSAPLVRSMGLELGQMIPTKVRLADGKLRDGLAVSIRRMEVGGEVVFNVPAVLMAQAPSEHFDGLLGMSFLRHFIVTLKPGGGFSLRRLVPN